MNVSKPADNVDLKALDVTSCMRATSWKAIRRDSEFQASCKALHLRSAPSLPHQRKLEASPSEGQPAKKGASTTGRPKDTATVRCWLEERDDDGKKAEQARPK